MKQQVSEGVLNKEILTSERVYYTLSFIIKMFEEKNAVTVCMQSEDFPSCVTVCLHSQKKNCRRVIRIKRVTVLLECLCATLIYTVDLQNF